MVEILFRYALLVGVALTVLSASFWLLRAVTDQILGQSRDVLMPFQVIGKDDPSGKLGLTLAQMLIARVGRIEQEMEVSAQALKVAKSVIVAPSGAQLMDINPDRALTIPEQIFEPLELKLSLGGVEVGPVLSWFHRLFSKDRGFRVSIEFLSDRAIVAGIAPGGHKRPVHLDIESAANHEVIDAFAYSIMQQQMASRISEVSALSVNEFKTLLTTLNTAAKTNEQLSLGAKVSTSYADLLNRLAPLVQKMPRWVALLRVAGQMAESSENDQLALEYYQHELAVLSDKDPKYAETKKRVSDVETRLAAKSKASIASQIPSNLSSKIIEQDHALRQLLASSVTQSILRLVGVESLDMSKEVVVAVAGGVPRLNHLPQGTYRILGSDSGEAKSDPQMEDYVDSLVQWVRVIAPKVRFIFAPLRSKTEFSGAFTEIELLGALDKLVTAQPQVILWTFGPMRGEVWSRVMARTASRGILLVQAAGNNPNEPIPFEGTNLLDRMVVAAAVDQSGRRAAFSPKAKQVFWAPGVQLPVQVPSVNEFSLRSGTSYSAAISASVAARLYSERHFDSPDQMVKLLRETASPASGQNDPSIINLANALERLHQ